MESDGGRLRSGLRLKKELKATVGGGVVVIKRTFHIGEIVAFWDIELIVSHEFD